MAVTEQFIIRNAEPRTYWGTAFDLAFAERTVERSEHRFPVPGLAHSGEVRAPGVLRWTQSQSIEPPEQGVDYAA